MNKPAPPMVWYFDVISPFAALAIPEMEVLCAQHEVTFRPVLFAGLLKAFGHLGPAEIPAKRTQTYRIVQWIADERGPAVSSAARASVQSAGIAQAAVRA